MYMGRATQDVPVYNCDYSTHYDLLTAPPWRPSALANIVMDEWCNTAEQQLGESADLYHSIWSRVMAVHCTVLHCNVL